MKNQLRWTGHVIRMSDDRLPKIALYGQLDGVTRPMGRPLLRYKDKLKANVSTLHLSDWEKIAKDRPKWRSACHNAVTNFEKERLEKMLVDRTNRKNPEKSTISTNFICDTCGKRCKSNAGLTSHRRSHAPARPSDSLQSRTCRICSKVCKTSRGLKIHLRVHRWASICSFKSLFIDLYLSPSMQLLYCPFSCYYFHFHILLLLYSHFAAATSHSLLPIVELWRTDWLTREMRG